MKKDINVEIAQAILEYPKMARGQFIAKIADTIFCPNQYSLADHKQCSTYICHQCWTDALRAIKFKGE